MTLPTFGANLLALASTEGLYKAEVDTQNSPDGQGAFELSDGLLQLYDAGALATEITPLADPAPASDPNYGWMDAYITELNSGQNVFAVEMQVNMTGRPEALNEFIYTALNQNAVTTAITLPTLATLVSFNSTDGSNLQSGVVADAAGNLFGTTLQGGANGYGTVFEIAKTASGYASTPTTLVSFNSTDGANPQTELIVDASGNLFGTTGYGGTNDQSAGGDGTLFELMNSGGGSYTLNTLVNFNVTNGSSPTYLTADAAGDLFGTTSYGGTYGGGTVFKLVNNGNDGYTLDTLANFTGANGTPNSGVIADAAGDLFGATYNGGPNNAGTVFELAKNGDGSYTFNTLVTFNGADGAIPGKLTFDAAGDLLGVTGSGGTYGLGTVFEIAKTTAGYVSTPIILINFNGSNGESPSPGVIVDAAGNIFGTTIQGGAYNGGTVFELANNGTDGDTLSTLVSFNGTNGLYPYGALTADSAGNIFGTTGRGGVNGYGTVFELSGTGFQVTNPLPTVTVPTIGGIAQQGQTLTASATAGEAGDTLTYQWFSSADGYTHAIGTGATYLVQEVDEGNTIDVVATVTNDNGATASATSAATAKVTGAPSAATSTLVVSPATVTADGTSTTTLTVTVEDANGNPVGGTAVTLSASGSDNTFGSVNGTTNASGVFTTTLASTLAQTESVTATEGSVQESTAVTFVAGAPSAATSTSGDSRCRRYIDHHTDGGG
jgi:uncharacterized repeat protein (TIGR03803 family)